MNSNLVIERLSKTYQGRVHALVDVSLEVKAGTITALLGPNGAGKTTLVNCIAGLVLPEKGAISYRGTDLVKHPGCAREWFAFVFEEAENVYDCLTVRENLAYFSFLNRKSVKRNDIWQYVEFFGLDSKWTTEIFRLSRGMKQKLALLIAFLKGTDFLILDEPTLGLDVLSRRQMIEFLKLLRDAHGKTVLLTTHDMGVAQEVCDYYAFLHAGQLVWEGTKSQLERAFGLEHLDSRVVVPLEEALLRLAGQHGQGN